MHGLLESSYVLGMCLIAAVIGLPLSWFVLSFIVVPVVQGGFRVLTGRPWQLSDEEQREKGDVTYTELMPKLEPVAAAIRAEKASLSG